MGEPKLNFSKMPTKGAGGNTEAGMNDLVIIQAVPALSKAKKQMLVVTVAPIANTKFTIDDYYTLFGTEAEGYPVEEFGQFKLRTLQEVTKTIPEGDYTLALIGRMLKGKKFRAELIVEPYNGKDYLKVGYPETFEEYVEESAGTFTPGGGDVDDSLETPATAAVEETNVPNVDPEVVTAVEDDEL